MGNRAVISLGKYTDNAVGIYLHWNGGRDSIEAFLEATKRVMGDRLGDETYGAARLVQVIGNYIGGNLSLGLGICSTLDCDNGGNGVYEVDPATMNITARHYHEGEEQQEYELEGMVAAIMKAQPEVEVKK